MRRIVHALVFMVATVWSACKPAPVPTEEITVETTAAPANSQVNNPEPLQQAVQESEYSACERDISGVFENARCFELQDVLKVDLNGDKVSEEISFEDLSEGAYLTIKDGQSGAEVRFGPGHPLAGIGEDFRWVEYWGILYDTITYEIVIEDGEVMGDTTVKLTHPSLFLRQSEVGGGLISFQNGRYRWVHQAD